MFIVARFIDAERERIPVSLEIYEMIKEDIR